MLYRILMLLAFSAPALADEAEDLHSLLAATDHLAAKFSQQQFDETGQMIDASTGSMALQKPNLVRWHILDPFEQLLLGDGYWLWQYDVELAQVVRRPYPDDTSQTPLLVFAESLASLRTNYSVSRNDEACYVLSPNDDASLFASMTLCFDDTLLSRFVLLDGFGQRTVVSLYEVSQDLLPPDRFAFDLPGEAELIIDDGYVR
ncbi:MAG TPA: outer membrane lipoprotein chaperone LolA [Pseudomonadales bacterium]|nr:outer membrane lipoprotein chaperone LolA [Pseudomonadales bacterium]